MLIGSPRPFRGLALPAEAHRDVGENVHLDNEEGGQIRAGCGKARAIEGR